MKEQQKRIKTGRYYPTRPATMMGKMSVSYGLAQISGPAITGWLATSLGSYATSLYVTASVMVVGIFSLILLKFVEKRVTSLDFAQV